MCSVFVRVGNRRGVFEGGFFEFWSKICKITGEGMKKGNKKGKCQIYKFGRLNVENLGI